MFRQYLDPEKAAEKMPSSDATRPAEEIRADAENLAERLRTSIREDAPDGAEGARITVEECGFQGRGGSLPEQISQAMRWQWIPRISRPANWRRD